MARASKTPAAVAKTERQTQFFAEPSARKPAATARSKASKLTDTLPVRRKSSRAKSPEPRAACSHILAALRSARVQHEEKCTSISPAMTQVFASHANSTPTTASVVDAGSSRPKRENLGSEVTDEDKAMILDRTELLRQQYEEFERRTHVEMVQRICSMYSYISELEVEYALQETDNLEEEAVSRLADPVFLHGIRRRIATDHYKRSVAAKKRRRWRNGATCLTDIEVASLSPEELEQYQQAMRRKRRAHSSSTYKYKRLRLDDALRMGVTEDWSPARIKAYKMIHTNPNAYYYRFNRPNEKQRNGPWSEDERELFFKRLREVGADGKWGIFSIAIPGRVGYQCSNYYRNLLKNGEVRDENYEVTPEGKLIYKHKTARRVHSERMALANEAKGIVVVASAAPEKRPTARQEQKPRAPVAPKVLPKPKPPPRKKEPAERKPKTKTRTRKRRVRRGDVIYADDVSDESEDDVYVPRASKRRARGGARGAEEAESDEHAAPRTAAAESENPLPDLTDPITLEPVERPTISPYGHVMGYETWLQVLYSEPKNTCPFTKQPLNRRQLTELTKGNIEEHRDKIVTF